LSTSPGSELISSVFNFDVFFNAKIIIPKKQYDVKKNFYFRKITRKHKKNKYIIIDKIINLG